jgi:hypothetical protein
LKVVNCSLKKKISYCAIMEVHQKQQQQQQEDKENGSNQIDAQKQM